MTLPNPPAERPDGQAAASVASGTPALFADLKHRYDLPPFPGEIVRSTVLMDGLRYTEVGDEGETVVFLGHHSREALESYRQWQEREWGNSPDPDDDAWPDPNQTWARLLFFCPTHPLDKPDRDACVWCGRIEPGSWWIDWTPANADEKPVEGSVTHYFPVTIWEVPQ